mmetsp:Transcript_73169/g.236694  ORF Transcript_73169/g.236694 Transcript_73169/m.236694 type:complete len:294 (+) Transcript_73169:73-954(+)
MMQSCIANQIAACLALVLLSLLISRGAQLKPVMTFTDKETWAWEITAMGYMMKIAQDNRAQVKDFYWAKALTTTAIAAFGGGFLAPLVVAHNPVPLQEETYLWMVVLAWYVTNHIPVFSDFLGEVMRSDAGKVLFTVLFGIFKTNQIVGGVELGAKAIAAEECEPPSRYFAVPIAAPLLCGFLGGCGGAFLPFTKGLAPISEGKVWNIRAAFFAPLIYYAATRLGGFDPLNAKMGICLFRIVGDLFPTPRDAAVGLVTSAIYMGTNVPRTPLPIVVPVAAKEKAATDGPQMGA